MSKPNGTLLTCTCGKQFYRNAAYLANNKSRSCSRACYTGDPKQRFMDKVDKNGGVDPANPTFDQCWRWTGYIDVKGGYGRFRFRDQPQMANRVSYILFVGEIPDGLQALHRCKDRRWCVNPAHLYAGTQKQNVQDQKDDGNFHRRSGENVNTSKLKPEDIPVIFEKYHSGISCRDLCEHYRIKYQSMWRLLRGRTWKHIIKAQNLLTVSEVSSTP